MVPILITVIVLSIFGLAGTIFWYKWRRKQQVAKNYERGLKMVPLLIHLPPSSDDMESGSRDQRDVTEEAISKAQVMYDIIISTAQSGMKSRLYGQRHMSFEIIALKGRVHFYASVPISMVEVVKQAILSAYPGARLEEVAEHNIFSPVGKISGTMGGEFTLKKDFLFPIATFQETKRDSVKSMLNAFSNFGNEDGAGIQILFRPAKKEWVKKGQDYVKDKKEGKDKKPLLGRTMTFVRNLVFMLHKPMEDKEDGKPGKDLTNLEQSKLDSIEDKTRHPGFETLIRVVTSSNTSAKAHSLLGNIKATFALFDSQGKNGFKFSEAKDIESFVTAYIMRFFPQNTRQNILNSVELATIFHFPDQKDTPTSQLSRQDSKQVDGPRNMSDDGLLMGYNEFRGVKKEVRLSDSDRRRHMYIVGQTGTGKSTILENLALQDMLSGKGFAFVDPHGDAIDSLMAMVPKERTEDIIYFCPADMDYPLGLNLFEFKSPEQKDFLIQEAINMLYKLYDPQRQGIIGPRYEHWFRNAALTLMSDPGGSTFIDIPKLFTDNQYAKQKQAHVKDQTVLEFWNKEMAQTSDYHKSEVLGWFVSKFGAFLSNEMMRNIIGQTTSSFDLREVMDEGKILFVNLSKGRTGELNSKLLGMIFVMKFQAAAMSRADTLESERRDFSLYVDEFQNFSTDSFSTILSEARKYRLNLIVANQYVSQLTEDVRDAVFGNVGSIVTFRTGATDAEFLVKQFSPVFDIEDLVKVPNFQTVMRLMINNVPSQPFSMATLPPLGHQNKDLAAALKKLSAAKYGKPKNAVEKEIFARLKTIEPPKPKYSPQRRSFGGAGNPSVGPATAQPRPQARGPALRKGAVPTLAGSNAKKATEGSFLDDWLKKRQDRMSSQGVVPPRPSNRLTNDVDAVFGKKHKLPNTSEDLQQGASNFENKDELVLPDKKELGLKLDEKRTLQQIEDGVATSRPTFSREQVQKADVAAVQKMIKENTDANKPKPQAVEDSPEPIVLEDDMYIDNEGKIHYKEDE